jgi:glycosyltransferase involved in cell wall biosynthesis
MRILIFCNKLPYPQRDGSAIAIHNMVRGYREAGAEVTVLALNTYKHYYPPEAIPADDALSRVRLRSVTANTHVTFGGAFRNLLSGEPYHVSRFQQKPVEQELINLLTEQTFDVIQVEEIYLSTYTELIRAHSEATLVLRAHNVEHAIWQGVTDQTRNWLKKAYLRLQTNRLQAFEQTHLQDFDAILPIAEADGAHFQQMGFEGPVKPVPVGLPLADYPVATDHSPPKVVFHLGAMDWLPNQRGVSWLCKEVWPRVLEAVPDARLALAGRSMPASYRDSVPSNVSAYGEVADAKAFMQEGAVMVVPLHSGSGLRIKILEGMALGKAIVSTNLGANGIQAADGQELLIADSAEAFSQHIIRCLEDTPYRQTLGQRARATVARSYDLPAIADRAITFLKSLAVPEVQSL